MMSSRQPPRSPRLIANGLTLLALGGIALVAAGCGGRGQSGQGMNVPGANASPSEVAEFVTGTWSVTVNGGEPNELYLPLRLDAGSVDGDSTSVDGTVADTSISEGRLSFAGDLPALRFTADAMQVEGVSGPVDVPGPTNWDATLRDGRFAGSIEGPDGNAAAWTAQKR